ncbi:hypothetical protein BDV30DRAFT_210376 [Aspergillus minisclerotigenes]|uniref:Uncharacterized protein n=1 Tax=Aspergillus minisclerotigenes TaxID=656917 RepID=A0A5N6J3Z0_9EURO|nr:hypothetical protein BDV30DRAFT_210376 [Aspergillus minisclerotigenes]
MAISGRNLQLQPETAVKENMVKISATIMKELIRHCAVKDIDLSGLDIPSINTIIGVLDEVKDYHKLALLLTALWDSRERYGSSQLEQAYTLALARCLVITRSLIGDDMSALHLAEDLAYNCSRVHGPLHPITIEMNVLLSQMYTSVAQNHQKRRLSANWQTVTTEKPQPFMKTPSEPSWALTLPCQYRLWNGLAPKVPAEILLSQDRQVSPWEATFDGTCTSLNLLRNVWATGPKTTRCTKSSTPISSRLLEMNWLGWMEWRNGR